MEIFHVVSLLVTAVVAGGLAALVATAARHGHATLLREGDLALLEDAYFWLYFLYNMPK